MPLPCGPRQQGQSDGANRSAVADCGRLSAATAGADNATQPMSNAEMSGVERSIKNANSGHRREGRTEPRYLCLNSFATTLARPHVSTTREGDFCDSVNSHHPADFRLIK